MGRRFAYLRERRVKCSGNCNCNDGLGHGPYFILVYYSGNKRKEKSLGKEHPSREIIDNFLQNNCPDLRFDDATFPQTFPHTEERSTISEIEERVTSPNDDTFPQIEERSKSSEAVGEDWISNLENQLCNTASEMPQEEPEAVGDIITYANMTTEAVSIVEVGYSNLKDDPRYVYVGPFDNETLDATFPQSPFCHPAYKNATKQYKYPDLNKFTNWFIKQLENEEFKQALIQTCKGRILYVLSEGRSNADILAEYLNGLDKTPVKKKALAKVI